MKIKKYLHFIKEDNSTNVEDIEKDENTYEDIKSDIRDMIENSLEHSEKKTFDDFITSYISNKDEVQIEGLINDSDVYDFYVKYRNDIDSFLSRINFYDEIPSEMNSFSLYDYVVKGTKRTILELCKEIKNKN